MSGWDLMQASVPGQSLTKELGHAPFELPHQYTDVNEALEYLMDRLCQPRQVTRLMLMLKKGVSAEYIARTILFQGFATGKWSPDSGLLMLRIVMAMIIAIATQKGVKPTIYNRDKEQEEFLDQFLDMPLEEKASKIGAESATGLTGMPAEFTGLLGAQM